MQLDPNIVNFMVGAAAGAVSSATVFPIEYAKTKMQTAREPAEKARYSSTLKTMMNTVQERGPFALWSGVLPVILGSAPEAAIQLATHSFLVAGMCSLFSVMGEADLPLSYQIIAGGLSGFTTIVATNPMEVLRLKASRDEKASMIDNLREVGLHGLFKGCGATWLRDIPFSAIYFPTYLYVKQAAALEFSDAAWQAALIAGMVSGLVSSFLTTPADVIKTRVQSGLAPDDRQNTFRTVKFSSSRQIAYFALAEERTENNLRRTAKGILEEEGWEAFFSGVGARVGKLGPGMAITLVVYEGLQQLVSAL
jgi:solute carrier family 25 aspartate/glutamate transporter 12/13